MDRSDGNLTSIKDIRQSVNLDARKDTVHYGHTCISEQAFYYQVRLPVWATVSRLFFVMMALAIPDIARGYPSRGKALMVLQLVPPPVFLPHISPGGVENPGVSRPPHPRMFLFALMLARWVSSPISTAEETGYSMGGSSSLF